MEQHNPQRSNWRALEVGANVLTAVLVVVAAGLWVQWRKERAVVRRVVPAWDVRGLPIDFASAPRTAVVAIERGCPFCERSMPFYRQLLRMRDASGSTVRIVVATNQRDQGIEGYLTSAGVHPDAIVRVKASRLTVPIVPALAIVGPDGLTTSTFVGALSREDEELVKARLFGK